ncbi:MULTISPECIES: YybH family protein [Nonomuraea]|jgi:ketosteroid isomerase-like protein|uniref:Ketosteroid isomerase-like protein n=2 Tax=Nonomuraea TaxID=83681 RepID=A0A7W5V3T7_9ACTN|nr:nuclear transport factor 2 family protein [Nonomuraea dietziae]MBB3724320.1 ketosteroid isomerase-like protein [Nonomuraea dietziae]
MTSNDSDVRALLESRVDVSQAKDIDRLMSHYSSDIVYYDAVAPLQFVGAEEVRRNFVRWFDGYDGPISLETRDLTIATSGDVAFAHMLHLDSGKRTNGLQSAIWVRSTVCCQRSGGKWLITHEHISLPINPENLQAWFPPDM